MRSRVFVSCGQRDEEEKDAARQIGKLLEGRGFDVYLAIDVQTLLEINTRIIRELKNSDCYLFVNFCRDPIAGGHRGSLFSNQELAVAYAMNFEQILVINQNGIRAEGLLGYIGVNTETFAGFADCCDVVSRALDRAKWTPDYSRRLSASGLRFEATPIRYTGSFGTILGRFLYMDINNQRPDIAALEATARLSRFGRAGEGMQPSPIRSPLKATARHGFAHTIFPKSHEAFDLLVVGAYVQPSGGLMYVPSTSGAVEGTDPGFLEEGVYLNTALDVASPPQLPIYPGVWHLHYDFFAIDFPLLSVAVEVDLCDRHGPKAKIIAQETL